MERLLTRLGQFIIRRRLWLLSAALILGALGAFAASRMHLYDDPNKWPPKDDPLVATNERIMAVFGGSNRVIIQLSVNDGDILTTPTLEKVKRMTDQLYEVRGVIPYTVRSLSVIHLKYMRFLKVDGEDFLDITPLMERVPTTPEELERMRYGVTHSPLIYGPLVSPDLKSTLISADFRTVEVPGINAPTTDPVSIYNEISKIVERENDARHTVRAAGTPITIGWVNSEGLFYIAIAFAIFLAGMSACLWFFFRNFAGVFLPVGVSLLSCLIGFLFYRVTMGDVLTSASALIAPFIIVASGTSHAVQFLKRFFQEELPAHRDVHSAVLSTFVSRFEPMFIALITEVIAFVVLALVPFENVRVLGIVTAAGMMAVTIGEFFVLVPALATFPFSRGVQLRASTGADGKIERVLAGMVRSLMEIRPRTRLAVGVASLAVLAICALSLRNVEVGQNNTYAIHNYLTRSWEHNFIYQMEREIKERFKGVYALSVLIESKGEQSINRPQLLRKMEDFGEYLKQNGAVAVLGLPLYIKTLHRFFNEEDERFFRIPDNVRAIDEYLYFYETGRPGAFRSVVNETNDAAVLLVFIEDMNPGAVANIVDEARTYAMERFNNATERALVGGGEVAIAQAFNENVWKWLWLGSLLSFGATFVAAAVILRSLLTAALLMVPLVGGTIISLAIIHWSGVEINSNTTTALAIAGGVGIDAEVYLLFRAIEEMRKGTPFREALVDAFVQIRRAMLASQVSLILGCLILVPIPLYVGYIGFGMAVVLLLCFLLSMVAAPLLWPITLRRFFAQSVRKQPATVRAIEPAIYVKERREPG